MNIRRRYALVLKSPTPGWVDLTKHMETEFCWVPKLWVGMPDDWLRVADHLAARAEFYSHSDALLAKRPNFSQEYSWKSIDAEILDTLSFHEPIFHEMTNRWTVSPDKAYYKSRIQYYYKQLELWMNIFDYYNIGIVITPSVPHRIFDYICYMVAQYKNIPFLMIDQTPPLSNDPVERLNTYHVIHSINHRSADNYKKYLKEIDTIKVSKGVESYFNALLGDYAAVKPKYLVEKEIKAEILLNKRRHKDVIPNDLKIMYRFFRQVLTGQAKENPKKIYFPNYQLTDTLVRHPSDFEGSLHFVNVVRKVEAARNYYKKRSERPLDGQKYVLFAASRQPERSTCPDAGHFFDHLDALRLISENVPEEFLIFFKEHPSNFRRPYSSDMQRTKNYYKNIQSQCPNVRFLSDDVDSFEAIDNSQFVATTTGTIGWEALARGKPAVIFGSVWYESVNGVSRITSRQEFLEFISNYKSDEFSGTDYLMKYAQHRINEGRNLYWSKNPDFKCNPEYPIDLDYRGKIKYLADEYYSGFQKFLAKEKQI